MVFVKVYANGELRRMQLEGPISYEDLKQKVAQLFPSLRDGKNEFSLQYTDTDGDSIVISSDEEIQAALDHLPEDHVWRVQVIPVRSQGARPAQRSRAMAPFGSFGGLGPWFGRDIFGEDMQTDPFWSPMGLFSHGDTHRRHSEWEELMKQREEQLDQEMERLKKMQEDHMQKFEEQRKKAEQDIQANIQRRGSQSADAVAAKPGDSSVAQSGNPAWHCQTFGSWEPVNYESPHGHRTVIGPVGYHMYWGYSDPKHPTETGKTEAESKSMETEEPAAKTEEEPAAKTEES